MVERTEKELLTTASDNNKSQAGVCDNGYKQYLRSRPGASVDSVRRAKELPISTLGPHPLFANVAKPLIDQAAFLAQMKNYKPKGTVFELGQGSRAESYNVMKNKRNKDNEKIKRFQMKDSNNIGSDKTEGDKVELEVSDHADISRTFSRVILPAKRRESRAAGGGKRFKVGGVDRENFIPYRPPDSHTEQGLAVDTFQQSANQATMDLTGDTDKALRQNRHRAKMVWDKKKKRMVGVDSNSKVGKIKSESGTWIPASYKSGRYKAWMDRNKTGDDHSESEDENNSTLKTTPNTRWGRHNIKVQQKARLKLKNSDQILKQRIIAEKKKKKNAKKKNKKKKN